MTRHTTPASEPKMAPMTTPMFGAPPSVAADKVVTLVLFDALLPLLLINSELDGRTIVVCPPIVPLHIW